jgi:hypothetical protein
VGEYRYKLDESAFQSVDSSVRAVSYGADPAAAAITTGTKLFTLRALDQAGGAGETNRYFVMNYAPDTWWAGPNPADFTDSGDGEYNSHSVVVTTWPTKEPGSLFATSPGLPTGYSFGLDSFAYRPSKRLPPGGLPYSARGTFYEIYKNRLYARSENDTIHMNSFIVLWNGGYDKDSRYRIRADSTDPALKEADGSLMSGSLLEAETANGGRAGSPIGFRSLVVNRLTPTGLKSTMYPIYEPAWCSARPCSAATGACSRRARRTPWPAPRTTRGPSTRPWDPTRPSWRMTWMPGEVPRSSVSIATRSWSSTWTRPRRSSGTRSSGPTRGRSSAPPSGTST